MQKMSEETSSLTPRSTLNGFTDEQQVMYQEHRLRVLNAKSRVNSKAPTPRKEIIPVEPKKLTLVELLTMLRTNLKSTSGSRTFTKAPTSVIKKELQLQQLQQELLKQQQQKLQLQIQQQQQQQRNFNQQNKFQLSKYQEVRRLGFRQKTQSAQFLPFQQNKLKHQQEFHMLQQQQQQKLQQQQLQQHQQQQQQLQHIHHEPCPRCHTQRYKRRQGISSQQSFTTFTQTDYSAESEPKSCTYDIPEHVMLRYESLTTQQDPKMLRKLLRPKIFLDFEVKNIRTLGRVIIQLYTEACPEVVLEFVRVCTAEDEKRFTLTRLYPPMWFECELALEDKKTLTFPNVEHDCNALDHGLGAGILSFPSRYIRGSSRRSLTFSLSFRPLNVLNGKRVAFGRVRRGQWILDAIQDFATTKNGLPAKEIIIKKCGVIGKK